jgi:hypothetical protein
MIDFQIIIISQNQASFVQEMLKQLQTQFPGVPRLFVLDRCTDATASILIEFKEKIIENKKGLGFLAGFSRDVGLDFLGVENTLFLDGDRIPVNFSRDKIEKGLDLYDICLISREKDIRSVFTDEFISNPVFKENENYVYSCGISIRKEMINKVRDQQGGRLFHPAFDGVYGEEDGYLGDVVAYLGGTCGLFPKQSYVKGDHTYPDRQGRRLEQYNKRLKMKRYLYEQVKKLPQIDFGLLYPYNGINVLPEKYGSWSQPHFIVNRHGAFLEI